MPARHLVGRDAHARLVAACRGLAAVALTLIIAGPSPAQDWSRRVDAAKQRAQSRDPSEAAAARRELLELKGALADTEEWRSDAGRAYFAAALHLAYLPDELCPDPRPLAERFDDARRAATRAGFDGYLAVIDLLHAAELRRRQRLDDARALLVSAIEAERDRSGGAEQLTLSLADVERERADFAAAYAALQEVTASQGCGDGSAVDKSMGWCAEAALVAAQIALDQGLPDETERHLQDSERWISADDVPRRLRALILRVDLEGTRERFARAVVVIDEALSGPLLRERPDVVSKLLLRRATARADGALGTDDTAALEESRIDFKAALEGPGVLPNEALAAELGLADLSLRLADVDAAREWLAAAAARLASNAVNSPQVVALYEAHSARLALMSEATVDRLREHVSRLDAPFSALLEGWRQTAPRPGGVGFLLAGSQRLVLSELIRLHLAIGGEDAVERALEVVLRSQCAGTLHRRLQGGDVDLAAVRELLLADGEGAIVYLPAMERGHVFVIDRDGARHAETSSRDELVSRVRTFHRLAMVPPPVADGAAIARRERDLKRSGDALYGALFPGVVEPFIRSHARLVFVGTGLIDLPLVEALPFNHSTLGAERAICHLSSLALGVTLAARRLGRASRTPANDLVVVGSPHADPSITRDGRPLDSLDLPASQLAQLGGGVTADRVTFLVGEDATLAALSEPVALDTRALAVYAHGVPLRGVERGAALVLTPSAGHAGVTTCDDIEQRIVGAAPAVHLFACGASRGTVRRGDDALTHLGGAFLFAGADYVVASAGLIADAPTRDLAATYHHRLLVDGDLPAEALRRARREVASRPATADPFFHAQLRMLGLGLKPLQ